VLAVRSELEKGENASNLLECLSQEASYAPNRYDRIHAQDKCIIREAF